MFKIIEIMPSILGTIVIVSMIVSKYFKTPKIFLLVIILASIFYQMYIGKNNAEDYSFKDRLINMSKFIIITGIIGYVVIRIIGLFFSGFE